MDEKTPHIHATVVPIVTGERRKAVKKKEDGKQEQDKPDKRQYRKKPADTVRLCADDIMTRENLEYFQDSYGEAMNKYGLQRGIKGSDARHISTPQYYRDLYAKNEDLKEDIAELQEQKQEVYDKVWDLYDRKDEAREKFLDMHDYARNKENEIAEMETRLNQLKQDYEPYKAQEDMNLLLAILPTLGENLRIAKLCKGVGLTVDAIKKLFKGEIVHFTGKLYSPEHERNFDVQDAKLEIVKEQNTPNKFFLYLNGQNITDWFKQKYQELKQVIRPHIKPPTKPEVGKNKGFKR